MQCHSVAWYIWRKSPLSSQAVVSIESKCISFYFMYFILFYVFHSILRISFYFMYFILFYVFHSILRISFYSTYFILFYVFHSIPWQLVTDRMSHTAINWSYSQRWLNRLTTAYTCEHSFTLEKLFVAHGSVLEQWWWLVRSMTNKSLHANILLGYDISPLTDVRSISWFRIGREILSHRTY